MLESNHSVVDVAQVARASDCGSEGRGFKSHHPPHLVWAPGFRGAFSLHPFSVVLYFDAAIERAPVAQPDRAMDFESIGRRFEPCRARHYRSPLSVVGGLAVDSMQRTMAVSPRLSP